MTQRIQIFRTGKHIASNGKAYEFSEAMLRDAAKVYDPKVFEAQIVVGHPKDNDPSYGQIAALHYCEDHTQEVEPCNVEPQFAELVNNKRFPNRSAAWYLPDSPNNPMPGHLYLKHVGFLGAEAPAIKGLKPVSFSASDEGVVEFSDYADSMIASMFRRMREFIIEKFSRDDADRVIPDYTLQALEDSARSDATLSPAYSEQEQSTMTPAELKAAQEKLASEQAALEAAKSALATKEASFAERETKISTQEKAARNAENAVFVEGLVKEGKVLVVHQPGLVAFMNALSNDSTVVVEFSEGAEKKSAAPIDFLKTYLAAQPKLVAFGEHAKPGAEASLDTEDGEAIAEEAIKFQESEKAAGRIVTTDAAVAHVLKAAKP